VSKILKHTILVIDDHVVMREIVSDILDDQDYTVHVLESTQGAMELIKGKRVSLLLLDVNMPGESGYDFLMRMKKDAACRDIPVIFMTGKDDIDDKIYGFELGAVDYIVKPFHRMDVLMRVKAHLKLLEAHVEQKDKLAQLNQAHISQMKRPEDLPRARFGIYFKSFQEAGGDFYDVIKLNAIGSYAYFIADISGHDIATSYVMPAVKALLSELLKNSKVILEEQMMAFNSSVAEILPDGKFITAQLILIDRIGNKAELINMGHTPAIYMPAGEKAQLLGQPGDILGVHENPVFAYSSFAIRPFDRFVVYTDGLLESYSKRRVWTETMYEVKDQVSKMVEIEVADLGQSLADTFLDSGEASDDVLIVSIEV
jgi:phosphoserine phosphatase RsbU/P